MTGPGLGPQLEIRDSDAESCLNWLVGAIVCAVIFGSGIGLLLFTDEGTLGLILVVVAAVMLVTAYLLDPIQRLLGLLKHKR